MLIIEGSKEAFFDKDMVSGYWEEFSHGWFSSETKCESYSMAHKSTEQVTSIKRFLAMNSSTGKDLGKAQEAGGASAVESEGDDSEIEEDIMKQSERVTQLSK